MTQVDVIIPCYKYGRFLQQCVDSVLAQEGVDLRVLVIDDASPDNTAEVAAALQLHDERITVVRHKSNRGHIDTYNEGIKWASADYMLLLSADDYLLPGALGRATILMDANPDVGFTFGNIIELSDGRMAYSKSRIGLNCRTESLILPGLEFIRMGGAENQVPTCTAVVRTQLQKDLGGYRHDLPHAGDLEMWLRFAATAQVGFISAYQGVYRRHSANMSASYYLLSNGASSGSCTGGLADFRQRRAAFDCFLQRFGTTLPRCVGLYNELNWQLAKAAISHASAAFNDGLTAESRQLNDFAIQIRPDIRRSCAWLRLLCKRLAGPRIWRLFAPHRSRSTGRPKSRQSEMQVISTRGT